MERDSRTGGPGAKCADTRGRPSTRFLDAEAAIEREWGHTPPAAEPERRAFATAKARNNVILRRITGERESYRVVDRSSA